MALTSFFGKKKRRVVVLGLDGVPYSLLTGLNEKQDIMPFFRRLVRNGAFHPIEASTPEISSVSWTNFATGVNPGTHGIYGFTDFEPGSYKFCFPDSTSIKAPTLWQTLSGRNKRSVIINLPATYPVQPFNGAMISGFVSPNIDMSVHPRSLLPFLKQIGYQVDMNLAQARNDPDYLDQALHQTLRQRRQVAEKLWTEEDWELFILVVTGTDRLHHFQFDASLETSHPFHDRFMKYYRAVDDLIAWVHGKFTEDCHKDSLFIMLSDHGFTAVKREVYLNTFLQKRGYLAYSEPSPQTIQSIGPGSRAFAMDPSRIYINRKGRYPLGEVAADEVEALTMELREELAGITCEGEPVIRNVYTRDELYSGPWTEAAPDLVLISHPGFDLKANVTHDDVFGRSALTGMHTRDNAFCYMNGTSTPVKNVIDFAPIILDFLS